MSQALWSGSTVEVKEMKDKKEFNPTFTKKQ